MISNVRGSSIASIGPGMVRREGRFESLNAIRVGGGLAGNFAR